MLIKKGQLLLLVMKEEVEIANSSMAVVRPGDKLRFEQDEFYKNGQRIGQAYTNQILQEICNGWIIGTDNNIYDFEPGMPIKYDYCCGDGYSLGFVHSIDFIMKTINISYSSNLASGIDEICKISQAVPIEMKELDAKR